MIIIPIGTDCGSAELTKKYNLRHASFPLDWIVSYAGMSKMIQTDFANFIPEGTGGRLTNSEYKTWLLHYDLPNDTDKIKRRVERVMDLLKNSKEEIVFLRRGHWKTHHNEYEQHFPNVDSSDMDDIAEAENLCRVIEEKYPDLLFSVVVILTCDRCYDASKTYTPAFPNIKIYNIAMDRGNNDVVEQVFVQHFCNK